MGDYADMSFERDFDQWCDDGYPSIDVHHVKAGDRCSRMGCAGHLVERRNKMTGKKFLGCSEFPKCRRR